MIVYNDPVHHYYSSRFLLVFHNGDDDDTVVNFQLHGVAALFNIRTPTDEDMEIFPMYEVTS